MTVSGAGNGVCLLFEAFQNKKNYIRDRKNERLLYICACIFVTALLPSCESQADYNTSENEPRDSLFLGDLAIMSYFLSSQYRRASWTVHNSCKTKLLPQLVKHMSWMIHFRIQSMRLLMIAPDLAILS